MLPVKIPFDFIALTTTFLTYHDSLSFNDEQTVRTLAIWRNRTLAFMLT